MTRDGFRRGTSARRLRRFGFAVLWCLICAQVAAETGLSGDLRDPQGNVVTGAAVRLMRSVDTQSVQTETDRQGQFLFAKLTAGQYELGAEYAGFEPIIRTIVLSENESRMEHIQFSTLSLQSQSITVTDDGNGTSLVIPDPGERVFFRKDLLDANPGQPGAPIAIPGYPIETASSGIKAPQYFAPGVAGDHGEPIAQYIEVGSYSVPNNLSANAHGNGYADPNMLIPQTVNSVQVDGGAFNVREGNHSVNLAATYGLRSRLDPFLTITGDYRDFDVVTGVSTTPDSWIALESSYGNGFLDRLEHRQQYKFNGEQILSTGEHRITLFGVSYYGQSYIPGLVPLFSPPSNDAKVQNLGDTIDPRQKEQTHTTLLALNDTWQYSENQQIQLSGFFRTYNLSLYSDFGQGLIRQSEFRTVAGGSTSYIHNFSEHLSLLTGFDFDQETPRHDDLDHYGFFDSNRPDYYGPFTSIDRNNLAIASASPYFMARGSWTRFFECYLGWRRDEINFNNQDLRNPQNSFQKLTGVNSPKGTISFLPKESWFVPLISLSFGQAFFTENPRIGVGRKAGAPVATSHSYQMVASKMIHKTDIRLTLGRVTNSVELAKIDPDTGLQFNQGPSRLRFMTIAVRHAFSFGSLQTSFSKADARDLDSGDPTPEAPRTIFDFLGTIQKLPFHLRAKGAFDYVGRKPLGTGCIPRNPTAECTGTSVKELRGAIVRQFLNGRIDAGINFLFARGFTGQTTENFYPATVPEVVGVRLPSYASVSLTYNFGHAR